MRKIIAYGGGTNSVAILCGMKERGERPDLILFADTGGEKPDTYKHIIIMQEWLQSIDWPNITIVRLEKPSGWESLEEQCNRLMVMPAIAYGYKTCSQRYKIEPQEKYIKQWAARDEILEKIIGYDFDETKRWQGKPVIQGRYRLRYPLVEWQWGRDECIDAIRKAGLPLPGKSACFFCPSSKKEEVKWLRREYPDLYARAVRIEKDARTGRGEGGSIGFKSVEGLGRHFSWETFEGIDSPPEQDCGCYDGEID